MKKMTRDKIVTMVKGGNLVGIYWKGTDGRKILFATTPEKADRIIAIFNGEKQGVCMYRHQHDGGCEWHN